MILLKANSELKNVFTRMIATMGAKVEWKGSFAVLNHFLILSGRVRSLVMNFENRKVGTNVIELPDREEDMEQVEGNEVLANVLNMSLYAFGKWGMIKGLKVEQDDSQLNGLFTAVLKDLKIRPDYRSDNFRFYKDGVQITYEEVVQAAIEEGRQKALEKPREESEKTEQERKAGLWHNMCWSMERASFRKEETDAYERKASRLGNNFYVTGYLCPSCKAKLHMCVYPPGREFPIETEEGKVFLARSYTCDGCSLYYTPRPGKLLREGDAYALKFGKDREAYEDYRGLLGKQGARVSNYNFNEYASQRGKRENSPSVEEACAGMEQMSEEELQNLDEKLEAGFFPLAKAEPYRKKLAALLRQQKKQEKEGSSHAGKPWDGERPYDEGESAQAHKGNGNIGEESQEKAGRASGLGGSQEKAGRASGLGGSQEKALRASGLGGSQEKAGRMARRGSSRDSEGRAPRMGGSQDSVESAFGMRESQDSALRASGMRGSQAGEGRASGMGKSQNSVGSAFGMGGFQDSSGRASGVGDSQDRMGREAEGGKPCNIAENAAEGKQSQDGAGIAASQAIMEKYASRIGVLDRMSLSQMRELDKQLQKDSSLEASVREGFLARIRDAMGKKEEELAWQKAKACQGKPYASILRVIEEIAKSECSQKAKDEILDFLQGLKQVCAQQEAKQLMANLPQRLSRSQYRTFRDRLSQYEGADISAYEGILEERRRLGMQQEIARMMGRIGKSSRNGLVQMLQQLKEEGYPEEEAAEIREKIEGQLRILDEQAIDKICPDIMGLSFDEAIEAYEKIEGGAFLPELKTNTLEMIDKRLTKIKMDECGLLVEKLRDDLNARIQDMGRIHYYDVRSVMRGDWDPREAGLVAMALNTYARERHRYEYPIIVCDSSGKQNGREGFVLTPEHIYYNSAFSSEAIPIRAIQRIEGNAGFLSRGLYVSRRNGAKTKIPSGIPAKELRSFGEILSRFVSYLQEKPESRSIAYLAKDKHEIKCCYRCGYHYREGNVCPKCGNRESY